jgi:hypothetical protein
VENAVDALKAEGFSKHDSSALFPHNEGSKLFVYLDRVKAPEDGVSQIQ